MGIGGMRDLSVPLKLHVPRTDSASKKKRVQRAHGGKQGDKGLRHFSMKVCEKVEQKGRTTYNEVADELVMEFANMAAEGTSPLDQAYDEKNIRRCGPHRTLCSRTVGSLASHMRAPSSGHPPPGTLLRAPSSGHPPPRTLLRAPSSGHPPPRTLLRAPSCGHPPPRALAPLSALRLRTPCASMHT